MYSPNYEQILHDTILGENSGYYTFLVKLVLAATVGFSNGVLILFLLPTFTSHFCACISAVATCDIISLVGMS